MGADGRHTLIIGGGIVGIACAHYLRRADHRVTVIDKARVGEACSHRNCGLVCPSHVLPLAEPGAIRSAMKALLSPGGAFRIRPRFDLALWRWLWKFARRCNRRDMLESGNAIQPLLLSSMKLYRDLAPGLDCEWKEEGLLFVYKNRGVLDAYTPINDLLAAEFDEGARRFDAAELLELEPSLRGDVAGAWYFEDDAHLKPESLLTSWRADLEERGVRFVESCELESFEESEGAVARARTTSGPIEASSFVIATGSWTPRLDRVLRYRVPIEPGKGYSVLVPRPEHCPRVPMIFPEHRVAVTPLETGIRLGSIMEFAGYDTSIRSTRLRQLQEGAAHYLRSPISDQVSDEWFGWRPMTYDSTPVIGPCPNFSNVYLATGHNMLGLSMAPATGRLISELVSGEKPHLDIAPYRPDRF